MKVRYKIIVLVLILSLSINAIILYTLNEKNLLVNLSNKILYETEGFKNIEIPDIYNKNSLFSFESNVLEKDDFIPWKNSVLIKFQEYENIPHFNEVEVLYPELLVEKEFEEYKMKKFSAMARDNDEIIFYELFPNNESKINYCKNISCYPTVLIIPGSGNQGAKDVINEEGNLSQYYYHNGIGEELVKLGYVVVVIENRGWGERIRNVEMNCQEPDIFCSGNKLHKHLLNLGYDQLSLQIVDTMQLLKYVQNLEYVQNEKIAIAGLSLGGPVASAVSSLAPDVNTTIIASGIASQHKTGIGVNPGALEFYDQPDIVATLAPKPLYLSWGINESSEFGHEAYSLYSANLIKKAYQFFDAEQNVEIVIHDEVLNQGHTFELNSLIKFLEKTMG